MIHAFKTGGYSIVLDISSGAIYSVDDAAYDAILFLSENGENKAIEKLKGRYPELTDNDLTELFDEIFALREKGKLFSSDDYGRAIKNSNPTVKAMCLNVSHNCNMRCSYCFAGSGEYGGDEGLMSLEVGKKAIDFLVKSSAGKKMLDVDFFGGEPLLNWQTVKDIVGYARSLEAKSGKKFRFTLTTNGLLIDDDVISFTNREMYNVVLSLDGRPEVHDRSRLMPDTSGSYEKVLTNLKKITKARRGKGYYIRGTYTNQNLDFVSDILHIADLGFKEISLEPAVSKPGSELAFTEKDLPEIFRQYEILAVEMLRRERLGNGFSFYHFNLDLKRGPCVHKRIAGCGVGTEYLAVTPSGKLYPCHQFIGDDAFAFGDVVSGITNQRLRYEFGKWNIYTRSECVSCWARFFCSGGCAANAYNETRSLSGVYKIGCEMFKKRLECAIMIKVAQQSGYVSGR